VVDFLGSYKILLTVRRRHLAARVFWDKILALNCCLLTGSFADSSAGDQVMSFVVWKILRLLPKPVLYILMFFLLGAVAKA